MKEKIGDISINQSADLFYLHLYTEPNWIIEKMLN